MSKSQVADPAVSFLEKYFENNGPKLASNFCCSRGYIRPETADMVNPLILQIHDLYVFYIYYIKKVGLCKCVCCVVCD